MRKAALYGPRTLHVACQCRCGAGSAWAARGKMDLGGPGSCTRAYLCLELLPRAVRIRVSQGRCYRVSYLRCPEDLEGRTHSV